MLNEIETFIREHAVEWGLDISPLAPLRPMFRSNPQQNAVVRETGAGQIGTVVFWFYQNGAKPLLISKIGSDSLSANAVAECSDLQQSANRLLGYPLFPKIHASVAIYGARVIFMEAVYGRNYEIQLARAVSGPERSSKALQRIVAQQFRELGTALNGLRKVGLSNSRTSWGKTAVVYARQFIQAYPAARDIVTDARIAEMAALIDTEAFDIHLTFVEDHAANYLPGPRAVDQIVPDVRGLCAQWPGPIGALRILLGYFRASPIRGAYTNYSWLELLALCIAAESRAEIVGTPVRRFLDEIGLASRPPTAIWALVMGVFFMRGCQELEFHRDNAAIASRLEQEFVDSAKTLFRIQEKLQHNFTADIIAPRLDKAQLDGEFNDRAKPTFTAFPGPPASVPRWIPHLIAMNHRVRNALARNALLYRCARWLYTLTVNLLDKTTRPPH